MAKLLMITSRGSAKDLASGHHGAFYNTLEEFHKYWERIDIISPKVTNRKPGTYPIFEHGNNVYVHILPISFSVWNLVHYIILFFKKARSIHEKYGFDFMTVHDFPPFYNGLLAMLLWQKIKIPYVLEIFHVPGHPRAASLKEFVYKFLFIILIKLDASKAKAVRAMNSEVVKKLIQLGVPESKIKLIPAIYIDLDVFKPMDDLPKKFDLIFVGRLVENKGIDLLLEAVKFITFNLQLSVKCLIVGSGPMENNLRSKIKNLKLQNNITWHGQAKDSAQIAQLLNESKILVMPSYNEGGPRVVVEALACGVPVLATPVGIVPDLLKNGSGGEIIAWEAEDIACKAERLLNDPNRRMEYGLNGLEIAKQFEKKEAIRNYADKLKEILG